MAVFSTYNSDKPDLREEIADAKTNIMEPGHQHRRFSMNGVEYSDPEWEAMLFHPLLETMIQSADFGDKYDYLPDKLSLDIYGTNELWTLILRVNGFAARHEFRGPRLKFVDPTRAPTLLEVYRFGAKRAAAADAGGIEDVADLTVRTVYAT